jgi:hypothetical protein
MLILTTWTRHETRCFLESTSLYTIRGKIELQDQLFKDLFYRLYFSCPESIASGKGEPVFEISLESAE